MADEINDTEYHPDDHQQAIEACEHALDVLVLARGRRSDTILSDCSPIERERVGFEIGDIARASNVSMSCPPSIRKLAEDALGVPSVIP